MSHVLKLVVGLGLASLVSCAPSMTGAGLDSGALLKPGQTWLVSSTQKDGKKENFTVKLTDKQLGAPGTDHHGYRITSSMNPEPHGVMAYDPADSYQGESWRSHLWIDTEEPDADYMGHRSCVVLNPNYSSGVPSFAGAYFVGLGGGMTYAMNPNQETDGTCTITLQAN